MWDFVILIGGVIAIAWVNWYLFMAPKGAVIARGSATGRREVSITLERGYSPSVVRGKRASRSG